MRPSFRVPARLRRTRLLRRLRRSTLRTRVLAGVLAVILVALAAFDVVAVTALRGYLLSRTDAQLLGVMREIPKSFTLSPPRIHRASTPLPRQSRKLKGPPSFLRNLPSILDQYYLSFVTLTPSGHGPMLIVGGNGDLVPRLPLDELRAFAASRRGQTVASQNGHVQLRLLAFREGRGIVFADTSLAGVDRTVGQLELILVTSSAAAGLLVALGIGLVVRRGLRPIETMAGQADRITAGNLTDRVGPQDPRTEVGRLGVALNGMLARIEASVAEREASQEATRRFFADASHELRNPLASLRANAELYQQGALPERAQVDEAMRRIRLEAQRMSALVDDMLRLARLDQHPGQQQDRVHLSALVTECAERAQLADPARTWATCISPGLVTCGDEELLRRAIDNLLANVRAHTPRDSAATVMAARHGDTITIEVTDDGPGVPEVQLPRIFDRFYRAEATGHRPGAGLGLAIVAATATAHHGTATAAPNPPHGLRVTVTLPASGRAAEPADPEAIAELSESV
jgi:two-component system, OmpR family, sensor kinase